jgi:hypothetical protein
MINIYSKYIMNKKFFIIAFIVLTANIFSQEYTDINFLPGSNVYIRIFLFYFPISAKYDYFYYNIEKDFFDFELDVSADNIKNEPMTPSYFESDLVFHIKSIPNYKSGKYKLPVTIQCNKKFIKKKVDFTIYRNKDIIIIKGEMNDLKIGELTENQYFKNRFNWKFPFYFDIRLKYSNK